MKDRTGYYDYLSRVSERVSVCQCRQCTCRGQGHGARTAALRDTRSEEEAPAREKQSKYLISVLQHQEGYVPGPGTYPIANWLFPWTDSESLPAAAGAGVGRVSVRGPRPALLGSVTTTEPARLIVTVTRDSEPGPTRRVPGRAGRAPG